MYIKNCKNIKNYLLYNFRHLRPHQIDGVKFLFESCVGIRNEGWNGCILADAMYVYF